ncbi:GNAT family N-acetyltransferase [Gilvimarinus sp. 1_MG-2023]|uniref:GNAT family N-acetyltransferase n=1 Tax=Gilvimarinus sp. 1_MG-2023 TaxID=3062638 RepID=UPI0026E31455|nr:GNAT family N-acetyltransferase [Gilvimarinus sp. 1_MG-2023]MDO6747590.1 GNAT family N-acetyltransferase [Gilvimarinus sp. 1_MG-2023]
MNLLVMEDFSDLELHTSLYITLRRVIKADSEFLETLFLSARPHLQALPLPSISKAILIKQQWLMKEASFAKQWPSYSSWVICSDARPIGVISIDVNKTSFHILEVCIDPEFQGQGVGTSIINALKLKAETCGLAISLSVDKNNIAALCWYKKGEFIVCGETSTHLSLLWNSEPIKNSVV